MWPWQEGHRDDALPRLHHWLIAAVTLFVMGIAVPLFAAFL
ncbi:hypothetical protein J3E64_000528 [Sphingobium sp. OAS761]|nr:hypothetical protein [Sphingobium sp. OAS761]MCP1468861.1 hypothetical protein [Sphingobium sp. OAS761]